jgi:two-component system cell cycle sensor histidine kinase/response regulator CckA
VIMGYTELLLSRQGVPDDARADAAELKTCAARAAALTRQLLAFSRQQPACPRNTDANRVVEEIAPLLRRLIGENIQLDIHLPASRSTIFIDPNQLEQVLLNLAVNARDAMPEGGILTIENNERSIDNDSPSFTPAPAHGAYIELSVLDSGSGIPLDVQPHIFEPFFTTKPEAKGTGLGLSTVYGIVTQNRGAIRVDTSSRTGTAMRVLFPVAHSAEETGDDRMGRSVRVTEQRSGTLLLVEDDPSVREYLDAGLRRAGYTVLAAGTGDEALRIVESHPGTIDGVISDVVMPGLSGRELASRLEQRIPGVRILFMSGYDQAGVPGVGALCGRYDLITKPFTITELIEKMFGDRAAATTRI